MRKLILYVLLLAVNFIYSQVDTVVKTDIYKSYISYTYKNPLYVKYVLYHGGGDCSRTKNHYTFKKR